MLNRNENSDRTQIVDAQCDLLCAAWLQPNKTRWYQALARFSRKMGYPTSAAELRGRK